MYCIMPSRYSHTQCSNPLALQFEALDRLLCELAPLWRPQPYKESRPEWCAQYPSLSDALLGLSDAALCELQADDERLAQWLAHFLPAFAVLSKSAVIAERRAEPGRLEKHLDWAIPGRKWRQLTAFVSAVGSTDKPVLEWCGGKGHLGRVLASRWNVPVVTLERDSRLCEAGRDLARRARVEQSFHAVDVLTENCVRPDHHAVALHACGELHRSLIRRAVNEGVTSLDIAPCCYHLGAGELYRPMSGTGRLRLTRDDLRLAVTETVTAKGREVSLRDREMAWKLGFQALLNAHIDECRYVAIRPINKQWLKLDFAGFCHRLARREGITLPACPDWEAFEARGWQRQREVMRLSLPRHAVRRALELWLVLDQARYLQEHGYQVRMTTFCDVPLTPRNILLSARRIACTTT